MKVLVAFASARGSTRSIAERIGARLRGHGVDAHAAPVEHAPSVETFDAVVVGSAIHDRAWLSSATTFMNDNARALEALPTWMFSVGMVDALPRALRKWAKVEGEQAVAPFTKSKHPRGVRLFSGVIRRAHLPWLGRVLFRLLGCRYGDFRDWSAIDAWADTVFDQLAATTDHSVRGQGSARFESNSG